MSSTAQPSAGMRHVKKRFGAVLIETGTRKRPETCRFGVLPVELIPAVVARYLRLGKVLGELRVLEWPVKLAISPTVNKRGRQTRN